MAVQEKEMSYFKHRGINDQFSSSLKKIENDHLVELTNFNYIPATIDEVQIQMREGTTAILGSELTSGNSINGIIVQKFQSGTEKLFQYNNKIYLISGSTARALVSGVTINKKQSFAYMEDRLLISNGTDAMLEKAYGVNPAALAGAPTGKYMIEWHNFVFVAGISTNKNRLQWCDMGDKDTWTATNIYDFPQGEITGLGKVGDYLYIFFDKFIMIVAGYATSEFVFKEFSNSIGCISHYGIVSNGSTLFFPAKDGIYAIGQIGATEKSVGGTSLIKLSPEKISTFWASLDLSEPEYFGSVNDTKHHCVRWSVKRSAGTYQDRELIFDYHENVMGFGLHKGRNISNYTVGEDSYGNELIYYGDSNKGQIYQFDEEALSDNGTVISGVVITKAYDENQPRTDKRYNVLSILAKGNDSEVPLKIMYGVGDYPDYERFKTITTSLLPTWDNASWDIDFWQEDSFHNYSIGIRLLGKSLVLKFVCDTLNKKITIAGWRISNQIFKIKNKTNI